MLIVNKIDSNVYCIRGSEPNQNYFMADLLKSEMGISYNSYLVRGEHNVLVDTLPIKYVDKFIMRIKEALEGEKLHYLIINQTSELNLGCFEEVLQEFPGVKIYCSENAKISLEKQYEIENELTLVETGDLLELPNATFRFVLTPFAPTAESMVTYFEESNILFSNQMFASLISSNRFSDEDFRFPFLEYYAKHFYSNVLLSGAHFIKIILKELNKAVETLGVIAPSHGVIWKKYSYELVIKYFEWTSHIIGNKAVIVYDSTSQGIVHEVEQYYLGLSDRGYSVRVFNLSQEHHSKIITELINAKLVLIGSDHVSNGMMPNLASFIERLYISKFKNKIGFLFTGSGFDQPHMKRMELRLEETGINFINQQIYGLHEVGADTLYDTYKVTLQIADLMEKYDVEEIEK